jgi:hypothetical protein
MRIAANCPRRRRHALTASLLPRSHLGRLDAPSRCRAPSTGAYAIDAGRRGPVTRAAAERAITWCTYLDPHACRLCALMWISRSAGSMSTRTAVQRPPPPAPVAAHRLLRLIPQPICGRFCLLSGFGKHRVGPSRIAQPLTAYFFPNGSKPNFWPPTLASNMRPPLPVVKTATPFWYLTFVDAPLVAATALA